MGTLPAVPSLLDRDREPDALAQRRMVDTLVRSGVEGVVALGTSGEGPVLDDRRRRIILHEVVEGVGERGIVVAGCHGDSTRTVLKRIEEARSAGCDAALVPPPSYYPIPEVAVSDFYCELADQAALPVLVYHIPQLTKNRLTIDSIERLALNDRIVGIKDSHGDFAFHLDLLPLQRSSFSVLQGSAALLEMSYWAGSAGGITPVAIFPEIELELRRTIQRNDPARARRLGRQLTELAGLLRLGGAPLVTNLKALVDVIGVGQRWTVPPIPTATSDHVRLLAEGLEELRRRWEIEDMETPSA